MNWHDYQLDSTVSKIAEDIKLWQTEKGVVKINKNTLAIPVKSKDRLEGYVFHGQGMFLLDTIVETEEGAIGKPVEKGLNNPFLMLGETDKTQQNITTANEEDLARMGYENQQEFVAKAEELFHRLLRRESTCCHYPFDEDNGFIFAFLNDVGKLDILVAKSSKLVYKAKGTVFLSDNGKSVLKNHGEVILSHNEKSLFIKR